MRPDDLIGVWRRDLIVWPDGRRDTQTSVHWLQARTAYADLRLPIGTPRRDDLEGFAGQIALVGDICTWERQIDYQPPGAPPDVGRLRFEGETLIEDGVHLPYVEHWRRIDDGVGGLLVLDMIDGAGLVVRVGRHVMRAVAASAPWATEISHAYADAGWRIHASTQPGRVGERLAFRASGTLFEDAQGRSWRLREASADPSTLLAE